MQIIIDRPSTIFVPLSEDQQNRRISIFTRYSNAVKWDRRPDVVEYKGNLNAVIASGVPAENFNLTKSLVEVVLDREPSDPLATLVMDTFGENIYLLENIIANGSDNDKKKAMGVLVEMFVHRYLLFKTPPACEAARELLGRISETDLHEAVYREQELNVYLAFKDGSLDPVVAERMRDRYECVDVIEESLTAAPEHAVFFAKAWLSALGIQDEDQAGFIESWMTLKKDKDWQKRVVSSFTRNFSVMAELHETDPEIVGVLSRDFGIVNFGRYPVEVLIDQYNNRNNSDLKYGVWLGAYNDHNLALNNYESEDEVDSLWKQARELGLGLRIVESGSRHGAVGRLVDLHRRFGVKNEMEFLVIGSHGNKDKVYFGAPKNVGKDEVDGSSFSIGDFQRRLPDAIKKMFKKGFPVAFLSCLADEGDLTKQFSIQWEGTVAQGAKEKITADGERITILRVGEELCFDISYSNANKAERGVDGGVYKGGSAYDDDHKRKTREGYWKKAMSKMAKGDISGVWKNFVESVKRSG